MAVLFYSSPRARFFDLNGDPLSLGRISYYYPGTTTLKEIFTDSSETTLAPNPQILDAAGQVRDGGVWLGAGFYDVKLEASDGSGGYIDQWTIENISGAPSLPSGSIGDVAFVQTITDLTALTPGQFGAVYVMGYFQVGDGGQGWFTWDGSSSATPDGGAVISPLGTPATGRWFRSFGDTISVWEFGATESAPGVVDSQIEKCMAFANTSNRNKVVIPSGSYSISTTITIDGDIQLEIQDGAIFVGSGQVTITCASAEIFGQNAIVDTNVGLTIAPAQEIDCYADWWGTDFAVKSAGNYPANLKFSGVYSLDPSADSSHGYWDIDEGSLITINNSGFTTTIKGYLADDNWNNIWSGAYNFLQVLDQREFAINHFVDALSNNTNYTLFLSMATRGSSRIPLIKWGGYRIYNTVPSYPLPPDGRIKSKVLEGSKWAFNNACYVGRIVNGPSDTIFDLPQTAYPIADNGEIYAQWFGASYDNPLNAQALLAANNWTAGQVAVSGDNSTFILSDDVLFTELNPNYKWNFKEMTWSLEDPDFGKTFAMRGNIELTDWKLLNLTLSYVTCVVGSSADVVAGDFFAITMKRCEVQSTSNFSSSGFGIYEDCKISVDNSNSMGAGVYTNCIFNTINNIVPFNGATQFRQEANYQIPIKITNCTFRKKIGVTATRTVSIINSQVNYDGSFAGVTLSSGISSTYSDVHIEGNIVTKEGAVTTSAGLSAPTIGGNVNCRVTNNIFISCAFAGTHRTMRQDVTILSPNSTKVYHFASSWAVLPLLNYDGSSRPLPYISSVQVMPTDPWNASFNTDGYANMAVNVNGDVGDPNYGKFDVYLHKIKDDNISFSAFITLQISVNDLDSASVATNVT